MIKRMLALAAVAIMASSAMAADAKDNIKVKTRLDHFKGTAYVLIISQIPDEITSITCQEWVMMGSGSYKDRNNFTIPAAGKPTGISIGVLDSTGFEGYCKGPNDIVAHTDDGDYIGHLDSAPGKWTAATKLTFEAKATD